VNPTRARMLGMLASAAALPACGLGGGIAVGSKNFTESIVIAEIYARVLEFAGLRVVRRMNLGSTQIMLAAMQRGDVDLYPEYTGTALLDVLHDAPLHDPRKIYQVVRGAFKTRFDLVWLEPSPMNDSQGIVTTQAISKRYDLHTLSQLARLAPHLRLATIPEFLSRPDGLPGLRRVYGRFDFASVHTYDISLKYEALLEGRADVATAFTTDGTILTDHLVVLVDDRGLWPPYNVAPVVRAQTLVKQPRIASLLNAIAPKITTSVAREMNAAVESADRDPVEVAAAFLKGRFDDLR
jgi:osmoprotectant transport system substrate-binding protein